MVHRDVETTQRYADYARSPHEAALVEAAFGDESEMLPSKADRALVDAFHPPGGRFGVRDTPPALRGPPEPLLRGRGATRYYAPKHGRDPKHPALL
jgi:hypothetical protein